jgi:hypothetical protein
MIRHIVAYTLRITTQTVETYQDIVRFKEGMHHMYIQDKMNPTSQWLPTSYKLTTNDVCLITNDLEEEWKVPREQTEHLDEEEEKDNEEEELNEGHGNGQHNRAGNTIETGPST